MHSSKAVSATNFEYQRDYESCIKTDVMPDIAIQDRLGVVIQDPFDGIGAATFILSCVTAFYDEYRGETDDFYAYPDYFTFQSDGRPVDYRWFDIWPDHKNVQTDRVSEAILRAITDRNINILLVPNEPTNDPDIDAVTRESFERHIDACYRYAHDGRLNDAAFSIRLSRTPVWKWIQKTFSTVGDEDADLQTRRKQEWRDRIENGTLTQEFQRIEPAEALQSLPDNRGQGSEDNEPPFQCQPR